MPLISKRFHLASARLPVSFSLEHQNYIKIVRKRRKFCLFSSREVEKMFRFKWENESSITMRKNVFPTNFQLFVVVGKKFFLAFLFRLSSFATKWYERVFHGKLKNSWQNLMVHVRSTIEWKNNSLPKNIFYMNDFSEFFNIIFGKCWWSSLKLRVEVLIREEETTMLQTSSQVSSLNFHEKRRARYSVFKSCSLHCTGISRNIWKLFKK